jgi:hypothetical protein
MHGLPPHREQAISSLQSGKSNNEHFRFTEKLLKLEKATCVLPLDVHLFIPRFLSTIISCITVSCSNEVGSNPTGCLASSQMPMSYAELSQAMDRNIFVSRFLTDMRIFLVFW